jgi:hypothetical protein
MSAAWREAAALAWCSAYTGLPGAATGPAAAPRIVGNLPPSRLHGAALKRTLPTTARSSHGGVGARALGSARSHRLTPWWPSRWTLIPSGNLHSRPAILHSLDAPDPADTLGIRRRCLFLPRDLSAVTARTGRAQADTAPAGQSHY